MIVEEIGWLLDGELDRTPPHLGEWPHKMLLVREKRLDEPVLLKIDADNTARRVGITMMAGMLIDHLRVCFGLHPDTNYLMSLKQAEEAVRTWIASSLRTDPMPPSVVYAGDSRTAFHRMSFDPNPFVETMDDLAVQAPTWHEMMSRMTENREAFCIRVAGLLRECDRKQAIWISGPKDCGKSQIEDFLAWCMGGVNGAYTTVATMAIKTEYLGYSLVGKRLVTFDEASKAFLNSSEFKALTGTKNHQVRGPYEPPKMAKLEPLFFFFSNSEPSVQDRAEIIERIIYCPMLEFKGEKLIEGEYQKKLQAEAGNFFGYCENLFHVHGNGRIRCDNSSLVSVVDFANDDFLAPMHELLVICQNSFVKKSDLMQKMREKFSNNTPQMQHALETFIRKFDLKKDRDWARPEDKGKKRTGPVILRGVRFRSFEDE